jgi:cell division inhibitor SepF
MNKIKTWVSGDPFEDDVYTFEEDYEADSRAFRNPRPEMEPVQEAKKPKRNLKVLDHPNSQLAQVVVIEPRAFEEALEIVEHLRAKKSVILNLHLLDTSQSQRVVDFLSGATHAIDGNQQRIGDGVFMFTANNVVISSESGGKAMNLNEAFWNTAR